MLLWGLSQIVQGLNWAKKLVKIAKKSQYSAKHSTEVLIHRVHVTTYVVKFFSGPRDFKVSSFKPVFQVEFKNRIYSGDQAFIFELYPIFYGHFSQKLQKTVKNHQNS